MQEIAKAGSEDAQQAAADKWESPGLRPYDYGKLKIDSDRMSLEVIIRRLREGSICLEADFQRASVWTNAQMTRWIESILIRLPLPALYFDGSIDDRWLIMDGWQRLNALQRFVVEEDPQRRLTLEGMEYFNGFEGLTFDDLPRHIQRRLEETSVTVNLVQPGTPPDVKYNIFRRLNASQASPLSPQEVRYLLNPGPVRDFLKELAESEAFLSATHDPNLSARMADQALVLRFLAFLDVPVETTEDPSTWGIERLFSQVMYSLNRIQPPSAAKRQREQLADKFLNAMRLAEKLCGEWAFRWPTEDAASQPVNPLLFGVWSVSLSGLKPDQAEALLTKKDALRVAYIQKIEREPKKIRYEEHLEYYGRGVIDIEFWFIHELFQEVIRMGDKDK
jgi:hypothetical protein